MPRHVLKRVVGGAGLVFPIRPVEDGFVGYRDCVKVISDWKVGHGGGWQDPSSVVAITVREVVL